MRPGEEADMTEHLVLITNAWRADHPRATDAADMGEKKLVISPDTLRLLRAQLVDAGAVRGPGTGPGLMFGWALCDACPHWIREEDVAGTLEVLRRRPGAVSAVDQATLESVLGEAVLHGGALVGPVVAQS